jgi:hypothetical protein
LAPESGIPSVCALRIRLSLGLFGGIHGCSQMTWIYMNPLYSSPTGPTGTSSSASPTKHQPSVHLAPAASRPWESWIAADTLTQQTCEEGVEASLARHWNPLEFEWLQEGGIITADPPMKLGLFEWRKNHRISIKCPPQKTQQAQAKCR